MLIETHENLATRIHAFAGEMLALQSLMAGSIAPNRDATWPAPHHLNRRSASIIIDSVKLARRDYLAGRSHDAAFHLGAASHYVLDAMVPVRGPSREHAAYESRFSKTDRHMDYQAEMKVSLADGRLAEHAVNQALRIATVTPISIEQRLEAANLCMLRLAAAVMTEREPMVIIDRLADAFVQLSLRHEELLAPYREAMRAALDDRTPENWDAACPALGPGARRAVGIYTTLQQHRETPALHARLLGHHHLQQFRKPRLALLERLVPAHDDGPMVLRECRAVSREYEKAVRGIRERRSHWDWFEVQWEFWEEKGGLALEWMANEVREAREGPLVAAEADFKRNCTAELKAQWAGTTWDRMAQFCEGRPAAQLLVYAVPLAALGALLAAFVTTVGLPVLAAAVTGIIAAVVYVPCIRRILHNGGIIGRIVRTPEETEDVIEMLLPLE